MIWTVEALLGGQSQPFRGAAASAIAKKPLAGRVAITRLGLAGDVQADRIHHGGPDMALHLYPLDHHQAWAEDIGPHDLLNDPGGFGSNLAVRSLAEADLAIGDRMRLGTALIEVSRPRQPCWKIEHRFGQKGMVKRILASGRCGWYFRVLEDGLAEAGDTLTMIEHGASDWTIARCFAAFWGTATPPDPAELAAALALPALAETLRTELQRRLD